MSTGDKERCISLVINTVLTAYLNKREQELKGKQHRERETSEQGTAAEKRTCDYQLDRSDTERKSKIEAHRKQTSGVLKRLRWK